LAFSAICIVGSGPAACGVALACAIDGVPVSIVRAARGDLDGIRSRLGRRLALAIERGVLDACQRPLVEARLDVSADLTRCGDADLVIDATRCEPRTRRAMLATLEGRLSAGAVLATSAPPEHFQEIAEVLRRPDQFVGMRFSPQDAIDVRIELSVLPETAPGVLHACRAFVARLGRTTLERASRPPPIGYREFILTPA
jgi:3-hydroxybutyryl-CoA dehydrogenase